MNPKQHLYLSTQNQAKYMETYLDLEEETEARKGTKRTRASSSSLLDRLVLSQSFAFGLLSDDDDSAR